MAIAKVFKNYVKNCSYFFKDGTQAPFINGKFVTTIEKQIKELEDEVAGGHPHIYIDAEEKEVDTEALTPMEILKAEMKALARKELLASGLLDPSKNTTSSQAPFASSVANTFNIAEGAAGSDGSGVNSAPTGTEVGASGAVPTAGAAVMSRLAAMKGN